MNYILVSEIFLLLATCLATLFAYADAHNGQFVLDDNLILRNPQINGRFPERKTPYSATRAEWYRLRFGSWRGRPFAWITFELNAAIYGTDQRGWHATNFAIHLVNVVLMFAFLRRWFSPGAAFLGAAVFGVHPLGSGAVAYVAGRFSLMCGTFYLAALVVTVYGGLPGVPLSVLLAFGARRCKEEWMTLPLAAGVVLAIGGGR